MGKGATRGAWEYKKYRNEISGMWSEEQIWREDADWRVILKLMLKETIVIMYTWFNYS
jgi:hypothetical protein